MVFLHRLYQTSSRSSSRDSPEKQLSEKESSIVDIKLDPIDLEPAPDEFDLDGRPPLHLPRTMGIQRSSDASFTEEPFVDDMYDDVVSGEYDAGQIDDDSPYPEVRCAVSNVDDPDMPVSTLRAWLMGLLCAIILPGVNQFMFFRYPTVAIGQLVAVLVSYPAGRLWARAVPNVAIWGIPLNPGPFTMKEHVLITIMASVGGRYAYATDIVAVQHVYYNQTNNFLYQWLLVMSTQLIGFSIGGICRAFLVAPPSMIWPANLVTCALFNTLHSQEYVGMGRRGGWSRERFFVVCFVLATVYYFLPGYLFTALSMFSWAVKQMFGYASGMGMSLLTFDWAQIAYASSPLATPWWAAANIMIGFVFFYWVLTPILYYKNVWNSQYMPIMSRMSYDNTGNIYNVTKILTPEMTLDTAKYKAYSPLYLPTAFAISYGLSFASITATIVHTLLYARRSVACRFRGAVGERPDIHARLMGKYRQVPNYWYLFIFLSMFLFGILSNKLWSTQLPVWALVIALVLAFIYTVPVGIIQAATNQQIAINVIAELISGYALPGRPIALMIFKTYAYIGVTQALKFTSDFKLGHYMKIPPRPMFWCQIVATIVAGTVNLAVQSWMFTNIKDICDPHQKDLFVCADSQVFYTASVIWGVIGPANQFSKGQTYYPLVFFFIIGAVLPLLFYFLYKRWPNRYLRYINVPLILGGTALIPPATAVNYVPWAIVAFIFQYIIRRRHFSWWAKYNYVLSAALDSSVAMGSLLIFFCLEFPRGGTIGANTIQLWWGNNVYKNTADWNMVAYRQVPPGSTFGPTVW